MWSGPSQDPGGSTGPPNTQELNDLKDQFEQQQLLIAQLKEMLRKNEQTTVTQEKVEEYANTLTKMKARAKRSSRKESAKEGNTKRLETPASEKINLLRQQLEENRAKFAERGKNQKGIEDMVTQLKAQLDDSQNLMSQTPLNISFADAKQESYNADSTAQELYSILVNKERRISEMTARIQKLEASVLDLQENLKEKDSVIDARTKAITLMSENLSKKGKSTLDALDDTKLQMRKMQENFVELEQQMKEENQRLLNELQQKEIEIGGLRRKNVYLEELHVDLSARNNELQEKLSREEGLVQKDIVDKSPSDLKDIQLLQERINELETLNAKLESTKHSIKEEDVHNIQKLDNQLQDSNNKCEEFRIKLEKLEKELKDKQSEITGYISTVSNLEKTIKDMTDKKASSTTESKSINLDIKLENEEISKLKKQLDESNKSMIKVKAQHKGKIKELNKKIDAFKKMSDTNVEVVMLHDENSKLNQRVAELEEEKGALQLKIMETDSTKDSTNVELVNELEKRVSEQAALLTEKENEINELTKRLEETTTETEELNEKLTKLSHLQNVQVKSEITSIQLEEQMDKLELEKQELIKEKENILQENTSLTEKVELLKKEKQEILIKLDSYMQENMDLVDKLEKLSAEKVSSAESIEIVEGLTQQEKLELEEYQKSANITSDTKTSNEHLEENPELNESVNQLTEETSELLQKIELFTVERREVMEKMEHLTQENNQLNLRIKEIENNRDVLAETYEQLQNEKEQLDNNLEILKNQNDIFENKIKVLEGENETLKCTVNKKDDDSDDNGGRTMEDLLIEIEEYKSLIEIQKQEIKELKLHLMGQEFVTNDKLELEAKVNSLQLQYENILTENETLMSKIKEQTDDVHQKENIEKDLIAARKRITEFEEKIAENLNEIENYKIILEENKNELISSANLITELQTSVSAMKNEVVHYDEEVAHLKSVILDLNRAIEHLEKENNEKSTDVANINEMTHQLEVLKQSLTENIEQINEYQEEIENNSKTIIDLQKEIKSLNIKILDTEHLLESKNDELNSVKREKEEKDVLIGSLQDQLKAKDEKFHQTVKDLTEKYVILQQRLEKNTDSIDNIRQPLENKIKELEVKNKEQLDKMKIIAANLKKKTLALQNLEQKYTEANEKWETEQKEKETLKDVAEKNVLLENEIVTLNEKLTSQSMENQKLKEELFDYKQRFNSLENMNTKLSEDIAIFSLKCEDAQNTISEFETRIFELNSENELLKAVKHNNFNIQVNEKDEIIRNLTEQLENLRYSSQTNSNALQMKIQELEMYIETQDTDLTQYKDRVNKLEEGLSSMEDRRMSLERTAIELGAQLRQKTDEYEEVTQTEDILEKRLNALIAHDEIIEKKLQDMTYENDELNKNLKAVIVENDRLNEKLKETKDILNTTQNDREASETLENEIAALRKFVNTLENDKRNMKNEYEQKLFASKEDIEKMDIEIQSQLEIFDRDRRHFGEEKEKMADQIREYVELNESYSAELSSYKQKLDEQQKIILNGGQKYEKLQLELEQTVHSVNKLKETNENNENTILKLNEEASRVSTEIELLKESLRQKSIELEQYQNQTAQIQTPVAQVGENQFNFDAVFHVDNDLQNLRQVNDDLHEQIKTLQLENENTSRSLTETQQNLEEFKRQTAFNKDEPLKSEELKSLKAQYNSLEMSYGKLSEENSSLKNQITKLDEELQKSLSTGATEVKSGTITTFTWPDDENAASQTQIFSLGTTPNENKAGSNDELLKKQHFLECVIQKLEKEKNDALAECHTLSGEVTKLLYYQSTQEQSSKPINPPESQPLQLQSINLDLESQIMHPETVNITPEDLSQLQTYEYAPTKDVIDQSASLQPVVEEVIQPSTSYLCYNPEDSEATKSFDTFEENDDGWGWGPDEAKLEQEHYDKTSAPPQNEQFKRQINILEEKIRVLELTRERHSEEIKQSQAKSGKLIKKLKEFKTKNEELAAQLHKKSDGFDDLNDAIQDELILQIKNLEKKIKEVNADLEKEKLEKNNLLKRVDTLTAGHERLVENKEKQDVEIMSWQQRYRELNAKLEQFEWGDDSPKRPQKTEVTESSETDNKKIEELRNQIKELTLDNEELQTLLEEQRNLRLAAEKTKPSEPITTNMKTEEEFLSLFNERDSLQKELNQSNEEKVKLKNDYLDLSNEKDSLKGELNLVNEERIRMQNEYINLSSEKDALQRDLFSLNENKANIEGELYKLSQINGDFQRNFQQLSVEKQQLQEEIKNLYEIQRKEDFAEQINQFNLEKQKFIDDTAKNNETIAELQRKLDNYEGQISNERQQYEQLNKTLGSLNNQINTLSMENNALQNDKVNLENEKHQLLAQINLKDLERNELQNVITDLNAKISNINQEMLSMQHINNESVEINRKLKEKEEELAELRQKVLDQEKEYEFKVSATIQQLTDEWSEKIDQRGSDIAESWKLHLESRENEFLQIEDQLKKEINELDEKYTALVNENNELRKNVDAEIRNEIDKISALQQQINERQHYINDLTKLVQDQQSEIENQKREIEILNTSISELTRKFEDKDTEINNLRVSINEKDNMITELKERSNSLETKNQIISQLKIEIENMKQLLIKKDTQTEDMQNEIKQYVQQLEEMRKLYENVNMEKSENINVIDDMSKKLQTSLSQESINTDKINTLQQQNYDYQQQLANYGMQLQQQYLEIEALNNDLLKYSTINQDLAQKQAEVNTLSNLLQEKEREYSISSDLKDQENMTTIKEQSLELENLKRRLMSNENQYEEALSAKDVDIESIKIQLDQLNKTNEQLVAEKEEFIHVQTELAIKTGEVEELKNKVEEQNLLLDEESKQLGELREIIQDQVLKIEDLQKELYEKSVHIDGLIAEVDLTYKSGKGKSGKQVKFSDEVQTRNIPSSSDDDFGEPANRAELDLALYMLHQRDVRCEELTLELMQLLEERDTLQLKLSNALREKELLRRKYTEEVPTESFSSDTIASISIPSTSDVDNQQETGNASIPERGDPLVSKLSELKTVGYHKDKTIVDEQELRRLQQLSIMHQHRDEAAKLPPEAAARLLDASYTLSRDVQSPSKVLLDWLWGRSTPKVNNV